VAYKTFVAGEEALAADVNAYLMSQTVARFPSAAARTSALTSPAVNQLSMRDDRPGAIERWNGSAWVDLFPPPAQLTYAELTTTKAVTSTVETSADLVVAAGVVTFDGATPVLVECFAPAVVPPAVAGANLILWLYQDGVSIGRLGAVGNPASATMIAPVHLARRFTPTAGAHALSFAATVSGATGTVIGGTGGVGQYLPAFIRVTRAA
jgi:hypothetical protein